jgi:hypothetical protein
MPNDLSTDIYVPGANHAPGHGMLQSATPSFDLKAFRVRKRESQEKFWSRFGVTQSSGSRFETGMLIPTPVAILVKLYVKGTLSDTDLLDQ